MRHYFALLQKVKGESVVTKKTYAYTTGTLGAVQDTINYSYTDTNWKDKLTSYNGTTITYDAIGNPLNYVGKSMTQGGSGQSQLMSMMNGSPSQQQSAQASTSTLKALVDEALAANSASPQRSQSAQLETINRLMNATGGGLMTMSSGSGSSSDITGTLTWQGRQLEAFDISATEYLDFEYDADGLRTKKIYTTGEVTTEIEYIWSND